MKELMVFDIQLKKDSSNVFIMATADAINLNPDFQQIFCQTGKQYTFKSFNLKERVSILHIVAKDFNLSEAVLKQVLG